jgi:hypothetical protein
MKLSAAFDKANEAIDRGRGVRGISSKRIEMTRYVYRKASQKAKQKEIR